MKSIVFPGLDITTRQRLKAFSQYFQVGDVYTLEVGCGNGAFALKGYEKGNRVLGIDLNATNIDKCKEFSEYINVDPSRCHFDVTDAFELLTCEDRFDQIFCFEVLEHLQDDRKLLEILSKLLKTNGSIHISTPYLHRKPLYGEHISQHEDGGHLRLGYTHEQLEAMLEASGFQPVCRDTAVGPVSVRTIEIVRWVEVNWGQIFGVLSWVLLYPLCFLDRLLPDAHCLQIYVKGIKGEVDRER